MVRRVRSARAKKWSGRAMQGCRKKVHAVERSFCPPVPRLELCVDGAFDFVGIIEKVRLIKPNTVARRYAAANLQRTPEMSSVHLLTTPDLSIWHMHKEHPSCLKSKSARNGSPRSSRQNMLAKMTALQPPLPPFFLGTPFHAPLGETGVFFWAQGATRGCHGLKATIVTQKISDEIETQSLLHGGSLPNLRSGLRR